MVIAFAFIWSRTYITWGCI